MNKAKSQEKESPRMSNYSVSIKPLNKSADDDDDSKSQFEEVISKIESKDPPIKKRPPNLSQSLMSEQI